MKFLDKIVVVTGGSRGIGFATVQAFLNEGATVVLCASRKETADKAVKELKSLDPNAKVEGIYPDLTSYTEVKESFDQVVAKYGKIDILVNNAGISSATPFEKYTEEEMVKVMDLNVKAVYNCSRAAADNMILNKKGVILNTSSMVSIYGQPSGVAYPTSKFALNGFTLSLARELAPKGIRVNAVAPGIIETDMVKSVPAEVIEPMKSRIPIGRLGQPEDIANAFIFLASEEASYITGVILSVDGLMRT